MFRLLLVFYNLIFIPLSLFSLGFIKFFNSKIYRGLIGRKKFLKNLKINLPIEAKKRPLILFHVSSFGEYLQAKPLMFQLKALNPNVFILATVFSPSGYENIKQQQPIDFLSYLPIDSYREMKKFISLVSPKIVVIVRHDIWPNFVRRIRLENIPLFLIDASLPQKSFLLNPITNILQRILLSQMSAILTISDQETEKYLSLIKNSEKIKTMGDTKYDQVFLRSKFSDKFLSFSTQPILENRKILVAGSSWPEDEAFILAAFAKVYKTFKNALLIIAPHEPTEERIEEIRNRCEKNGLTSVCLSKLGRDNHVNCIIVDQIGILANIYSLGTAAFVGGSFHTKIHNVLEPAVYGVPIFFGPKMKNSVEAITLLESDAATVVESVEQITELLNTLFRDADYAGEFGKRAKDVVEKNIGSANRIAQFLLDQMKSEV